MALQPQTITGTWDVAFHEEVEEGRIAIGREQMTFRPDYWFTTDGGFFLIEKETQFRALSFAAQRAGQWKFVNDKLYLRPRENRIGFYSTWIEGTTRETIQEMLTEASRKFEVYSIGTFSEDFIILDGDEGQSTMTMTRIDPNPTVILRKNDATLRQGIKSDPRGRRYRRFSEALLAKEGFTAAKGLPTMKRRAGIGNTLRPVEEIIDRLLCNYVVLAWVALPEEETSTKALQRLIRDNELGEKLTAKEKKILRTKRQSPSKATVDAVAQKTENLWTLAWILGFDLTPEINQEPISQEFITKLFHFLAPLRKGKEEFLENVHLRSFEEVAQLEDIFYSAHSAFTSAQQGTKDAIPQHFHTRQHNKIILAKRHALTWSLSPGITWNQTSLKT